MDAIQWMVVMRYFFCPPSLFCLLTIQDWPWVCFGPSHEAHHSVKISQTLTKCGMEMQVKLERVRVNKTERITAKLSNLYFSTQSQWKVLRSPPSDCLPYLQLFVIHSAVAHNLIAHFTDPSTICFKLANYINSSLWNLAAARRSEAKFWSLKPYHGNSSRA